MSMTVNEDPVLERVLAEFLLKFIETCYKLHNKLPVCLEFVELKL